MPFNACYCLLFKLGFQNPVHFANGFFFQLRTAYQFIGTKFKNTFSSITTYAFQFIDDPLINFVIKLL